MERPEEVISRAKQKMAAIISSVADIKDKNKILELAEQNKGFVFVSLGLHPHNAISYSDEEIDKYVDFIRNNKEKIVAIGECGLDYVQVEPEKRERAETVFLRLKKLAEEIDKPLVLHVRDEPGSNSVFNKMLKLIEKVKIPVVFHCFSGSKTQLNKALDCGYYISFATLVCKSDKHKRLAKGTPLENMLLETDSPWLHPTSREMINRPWLIEESAKAIAEIKGTAKEEILQTTTENAKKVFGI